MRKKYLAVAKSMRRLADSIEALTEATDEQHVTDVEEVREPVTFEELRAVLAGLTRDGKQQEVKKLITEYGAAKLSDVPEEKYEELLNKARKL